MSAESIYAHAIPQVDGALKGIHLLWTGPRPWIYSTEGWFIQRRRALVRSRPCMCEDIPREDIEELRDQREKRLSFATLRMEEGMWPTSVITEVPPATACDIFTIELDKATPKIRIHIEAEASFLIILRNGKVIAAGWTSL